jgi:hypothetical protein
MPQSRTSGNFSEHVSGAKSFPRIAQHVGLSGMARGRLQRREPRPATRAAPYVALLPTDSCYGHVCGLLFTPVQVVTSLFG